MTSLKDYQVDRRKV